LPNKPAAFGRKQTIGSITTDSRDGHGTVHNQLLLRLPQNVCKELLQRSHFTHIPVHTVLNEVNRPIEDLYFIDGGLASVLTVMKDGKSVEVGLTGREGFVGTPVIAGLKTSPVRVIMQVTGTAHRISVKDMEAALEDFPVLAKTLSRFSQEMTLQAVQIAACNRIHEVDARLARWLLMSQDRIGGSLVPLTQEFLAHMLGTRRASVTIAAGALQKAGLISYMRGELKIENRQQLENTACECYGALRRQLNAWKSESGSD
jgi:CRP-like cAMP-binding protein